MNWNALVGTILLGLIVCRYAIPAILRMMWQIEYDAKHPKHHIFCREDGSEWQGASPAYYTYQPKRK